MDEEAFAALPVLLAPGLLPWFALQSDVNYHLHLCKCEFTFTNANVKSFLRQREAVGIKGNAGIREFHD